ncbi:uncharacterized protein [Haliotis cracherodii]|uniref:uncharacterized protein n=1 Tax=Haliotis cracherodii TaxID=6455 RepID=UPI0039E99706
MYPSLPPPSIQHLYITTSESILFNIHSNIHPSLPPHLSNIHPSLPFIFPSIQQYHPFKHPITFLLLTIHPSIGIIKIGTPITTSLHHDHCWYPHHYLPPSHGHPSGSSDHYWYPKHYLPPSHIHPSGSSDHHWYPPLPPPFSHLSIRIIRPPLVLHHYLPPSHIYPSGSSDHHWYPTTTSPPSHIYPSGSSDHHWYPTTTSPPSHIHPSGSSDHHWYSTTTSLLLTSIHQDHQTTIGTPPLPPLLLTAIHHYHQTTIGTHHYLPPFHSHPSGSSDHHWYSTTTSLLLTSHSHPSGSSDHHWYSHHYLPSFSQPSIRIIRPPLVPTTTPLLPSAIHQDHQTTIGTPPLPPPSHSHPSGSSDHHWYPTTTPLLPTAIHQDHQTTIGTPPLHPSFPLPSIRIIRPPLVLPPLPPPSHIHPSLSSDHHWYPTTTPLLPSAIHQDHQTTIGTPPLPPLLLTAIHQDHQTTIGTHHYTPPSLCHPSGSSENHWYPTTTPLLPTAIHQDHQTTIGTPPLPPSFSQPSIRIIRPPLVPHHYTPPSLCHPSGSSENQWYPHHYLPFSQPSIRIIRPPLVPPPLPPHFSPSIRIIRPPLVPPSLLPFSPFNQ